jgi:NTP pyrophosphatase (non-canonical NTP hydrolase)
LPANDRTAPGISERLSDAGAIRLLHAAIGFATEAGEILQALHDYVYLGTPLDPIHLVEEGGDVFWYAAIYADSLSVTFENIQDRNNRKLRARYPDKFEQDQALTRDLDAERRALDPQTCMAFCHQDLAPEAVTEIVRILQDHCGERGDNEGAVETLQRIIREHYAPAAPPVPPVVKHASGLYDKFRVSRTDGKDAPGGKHHGCFHYVLDATHDKHARPALLAYAASCEKEYPALAADLRSVAERTPAADSRCETVSGLQAHIYSWDQENGYIHGYVEGNPEPQTWGIPDGQCLTSHGDSRYDLNMETLK